MNKWYRACVEYNASVPEYHALLHKNVFTEDAALASIKKLKHYLCFNNMGMVRMVGSSYYIRGMVLDKKLVLVDLLLFLLK